MQLWIVLAAIVDAAPFRILADEPGRWEIEWEGPCCRVDSLSDGRRTFSVAGVPASDVPGDLEAPRLTGWIALPATGDWNVEYPVDSGSFLEGAVWKRVPRWDPVAQRQVEAAPRDRPGWEVKKADGFRLLRMDLPLVVPGAKGVRMRTRVRARVTWNGAATVPSGSIWKKAVGNPGGVRVVSRPALRAVASRGAGFGGTMLELTVGDGDPFGSLEDGWVRLKGSDLSAISGGWAIRNIAVYSGAADTVPTAMSDSVPAPGLRAIPIERLDRSNDGFLDADDEIRFWVRGGNLWKASEGNAVGWRYSINPYARDRRYLIRLDAPEGSPDLPDVSGSVSGRRFEHVLQPVWIGRPDRLKELVIGKSTETELDLGKSWFWKSTEETGTVSLPVAGAAFPGRVDDSAWVRPAIVSNGWFYGSEETMDSLGVQGASSRWESTESGTWAGTGLHAASAIDFRFNGSRLAIAGLNVGYRRDLSVADSVLFPAPAMGAIEVRVPATGTAYALEDGVAVRRIQVRSGYLIDSVRVPGTWYLVVPSGSAGAGRPLKAWAAPSQAHAVKDFSVDRSADILVVAHPSLMDVAEEYAVHREAEFQVRRMKVAIVRTQDVYDLWSGGQMDPNGIRDAIRWAHSRWGVSHVLLMGGGHVDPRQVMGASAETLVPHWEDGAVSTDDHFSYLGAGDPAQDGSVHVPGVAVGRVPARSVAEAKAWLAKLKTFEDPSRAEFGPWRNSIALVADDVWQMAKPDEIGNHTRQTESVSGVIDGLRPWIRQEKLYEVTYPANNLSLKPEAARDLQALLNKGVFGFNYLGHGGSSILADENILDINAVDRTLVNAKRPFVFFAGSCTVGRNDLPNGRGLSEAMVIAADKGATAGVAGTRPTYPTGNGRISADFWRHVVDTAVTMTLGEALVAAKGASDETLEPPYTNQDAYNILGDPAQILVPGGIAVRLEELPDTISALSRVRVRGRAPGAAKYEARMEVAADLDTAVRASTSQQLQIYRLSPHRMATIQGAVADDSIGSTMQVPARIAFGDSAAVRVYAWNPSTRRDGGGLISPRLLAGTDSSGKIEYDGPEISIRPCDSSWSAGVAYGTSARIPLPFCLAVDLFDSSGISSETGPDEGVVFSIPGVKEPWHPELRQEADFRRVSAQFVADSTVMEAGRTYTFDVSARDMMGNLSRSRLLLEPTEQSDVSLYEVFNSPNPVRSGERTAFYFKLASEPDTNGMVDPTVDVAIRIHTVSGKLVRVLRTELDRSVQPRPRAVWDLRDSFGTPVANGLYPFTVVLRASRPGGIGTKEIVRKGIVAVSR